METQHINAPAGWYTVEDGRRLYWDGSAWIENPRRNYRPVAWLAGFLAVLGLIGYAANATTDTPVSAPTPAAEPAVPRIDAMAAWRDAVAGDYAVILGSLDDALAAMGDGDYDAVSAAYATAGQTALSAPTCPDPVIERDWRALGRAWLDVADAVDRGDFAAGTVALEEGTDLLVRMTKRAEREYPSLRVL